MEAWFNDYMNGVVNDFPQNYSEKDIDFLMKKINEQPDDPRLINLFGLFYQKIMNLHLFISPLLFHLVFQNFY